MRNNSIIYFSILLVFLTAHSICFALYNEEIHPAVATGDEILIDVDYKPYKPIFNLSENRSVIEVTDIVEISDESNNSKPLESLKNQELISRRINGKRYTLSGMVGVLFGRSEKWKCIVTPSSGNVNGDPIEVSLSAGSADDKSIEVSLVPENPVAGEELRINLTVNAYAGLDRVAIYVVRVINENGARIDNYSRDDYYGDLNGVISYSNTFTYTPPVDGIYKVVVDGRLSSADREIFRNEFYFSVSPGKRDNDKEDFLAWMSRQGYSREICDMYRRHLSDTLIRQSVQGYFDFAKGKNIENRPVILGLKNNNLVTLYLDEIFPTDNGATQSEPMADYTDALEQEYQDVLGTQNIEIIPGDEYRVNYMNEYGPIILDGNRYFQFSGTGKMKRFMVDIDQATNTHILHWALETIQWEGSPRIWREWTQSSPAFTNLEFNLEDDYLHKFYRNMIVHEWLHGLAIGHHFYPPAGGLNGLPHEHYERHFFGADCAMVHTYVRYTNQRDWNDRQIGFFRMLCPLCRYVLEPRGGYQNAREYMERYNEHMAGSWMMTQSFKPTEAYAFIPSWTTIGNPLKAKACGSFARQEVQYLFDWYKDDVPQNIHNNSIPKEMLNYELVPDENMIFTINDREISLNEDGQFSKRFNLNPSDIIVCSDKRLGNMDKAVTKSGFEIDYKETSRFKNQIKFRPRQNVFVLKAESGDGLTSIKTIIIKYKIEIVKKKPNKISIF